VEKTTLLQNLLQWMNLASHHLLTIHVWCVKRKGGPEKTKLEVRKTVYSPEVPLLLQSLTRNPSCRYGRRATVHTKYSSCCSTDLQGHPRSM